MTTAQDGLADLVIRQISPSRDIAAVNKFAAGIVEFVSTGTRTLNGVVDGAPASRFAGGISPFFTHVAGTPWREYLVMPSTIQAGDTISITIDGSIHAVTLPGSFSATGTPVQYDGDRISSIIPNAVLITGAGDELGGPISTVQAGRLGPGQRGLVVYEHQPPTAGGGKMFVINPNQATGIPIPAFRTVSANPPTGTLVGEAILNTNNGLSFVWDGLAWQPIVPPSIVPYPNDSDILTDNLAAPGTYAFSRSTGNLFVRFTDPGAGTSPGNDVWREIGIMQFPLESGLLAAAAAEGSIGYAVDTGNYFVHIGTAWQTFGENRDTEAHILASNYADGSRAYATDTNQFWIRLAGSWEPDGVNKDTEANILAANYRDGTTAYATDTDQFWVRVNSVWEPLYILHDTNANILAKTPRDGTVAYSTDLNLIWYRINGAWQPGSIPHDTTANILGSNFYDGARCYDTTLNITWVRIDGNWLPESYLRDTEANILAATPTAGLIGVATDKCKIYYGDGTTWQGQPFRDYTTEAALLADTPVDGIMAVAIDTGKTYYRSGGIWVNVGGYAVPTGSTDPAIATATTGDLFYNTTIPQMRMFDGTTSPASWIPIGASALDDLNDVDTTTKAPANRDSLVFNSTTNLFEPKSMGVQMGGEPALASRYPGMLWDNGSRLFIWLGNPAVWRQV